MLLKWFFSKNVMAWGRTNCPPRLQQSMSWSHLDRKGSWQQTAVFCPDRNLDSLKEEFSLDPFWGIFQPLLLGQSHPLWNRTLGPVHASEKSSGFWHIFYHQPLKASKMDLLDQQGLVWKPNLLPRNQDGKCCFWKKSILVSVAERKESFQVGQRSDWVFLLLSSFFPYLAGQSGALPQFQN